MPICAICDDTGLQNSDPKHPEFCFCAAGKQARRQWEKQRVAEREGREAPQATSFIDIAQLEQVNANVDTLRASLLGNAASSAAMQTRHPAVQLLLQVAHPGHEISAHEATQLYDLAKALEIFLQTLAPIGRTGKR